MELAALQSLIDAEVLGVLGYLIPLASSLFPVAQWFSLNVGPRSIYKDRVHPLLSLTSPTECIAACHLLGHPRVPNASYRVSFPIATRARRVHKRRVPKPDYVSPTAFLTLSTSYSSTGLAGLFHPTATSGICTSGTFPAAKPARLIDESFPHAVTGVLLPASCLTGARSTRPDYRALIQAAIRCGQQGV
jgi:hypothetical protein